MTCQHFFLASRRTIAHARAQTTPADHMATHEGIAMRVHLEEKISVAARMMAILEAVADREPVPCASEHA